MFNLLTLFAADRQILEDRGAFVIRQLCILMNSEDIYRSLSDILLQVLGSQKGLFLSLILSVTHVLTRDTKRLSYLLLPPLLLLGKRYEIRSSHDSDFEWDSVDFGGVV